MQKFTFSQSEKTELERLGVEAVILFGSHAEGIAGPLSDVDIGILIERIPRSSAPGSAVV